MSITLSHPTAVLNGVIDLPISKSICNRALILQQLAEGGSIAPLSDCDDTRVLQRVLLNKNADSIDVGAAGTAMRFLTALLSVSEGVDCTLTGSERMKHRPIGPLVEALKQLGASICYVDEVGFPPLRIVGKRLKGGCVKMRGDVSSQFISALMMVAPTMEQGLHIELEQPVVSRPYIEMTRSVMRAYGVEIQMQGDVITIPHATYVPCDYKVEADWSAASYWYEALALAKGGTIQLRGLHESSLQGDSSLVDIYRQLGVETIYGSNGVELRKVTPSPNDFVMDFTDTPDLVQAVVVTCCLLGKHFCIKGVGNLRIKETDRLKALTVELRKLGYKLTATDDAIVWNGAMTTIQTKPSICTYDDHRMAMAFAPASLCMPLTIENESVVTKSYPTFWNDVHKVGFEQL